MWPSSTVATIQAGSAMSLILETSTQHVLLHESVRRRLQAHLGILHVLDVADDPFQHREILLDALRDAIVVVPDFRLRCVDVADRIDVAIFDSAEKFACGLHRLLDSLMNPYALQDAAWPWPSRSEIGVGNVVDDRRGGRHIAIAVAVGTFTVGSDSFGIGVAVSGVSAALGGLISAVPTPYSYTSLSAKMIRYKSALPPR